MSEPIKKGDLVVVVKPSPCCGSYKRIGYVFRADYIMASVPSCGLCGAVNNQDEIGVWQSGAKFSIQLPRLKRIPPLSELEGERTQEDIREPA